MEEVRDERCHSYLPPPVVRRRGGTGRTNPFHRSISKQTSVYSCIQSLRTLSSQRVKVRKVLAFGVVFERGREFLSSLKEEIGRSRISRSLYSKGLRNQRVNPLRVAFFSLSNKPQGTSPSWFGKRVSFSVI
ncbi:hypothetical protein AVEN_194994-1 [Araneus ventricosus]|uniref:Uncharacterized protein n=1 Tax=Araneus ventricosus TaxID=182803 RepID=A0A4Y2HPF3_ARAVE|nr:hypothetical protein AVEN_194994-1 [Araneus ventricosus]